MKAKEAKNFSKSGAELVDVMDTRLRVISTIEKEMAKNPTFMQKEIDTLNTNIVIAAVNFNVNSLQRTVLMMRRTTEQVPDVSCGNAAAFVGTDQFILKLGTLTYS